MLSPTKEMTPSPVHPTIDDIPWYTAAARRPKLVLAYEKKTSRLFPIIQPRTSPKPGHFRIRPETHVLSTAPRHRFSSGKARRGLVLHQKVRPSLPSPIYMTMGTGDQVLPCQVIITQVVVITTHYTHVSLDPTNSHRDILSFPAFASLYRWSRLIIP